MLVASSAVKIAKTQTGSKDTIVRMTNLFETKNNVDEIGTFFRFLIKEAKIRKPANAHDVRKAEFNYEWYKLGFFTDWHTSGKAIALCFGLPDTLRDSIKKAVMTNGMGMPLIDPFALHTVLVEEVVV